MYKNNGKLTKILDNIDGNLVDNFKMYVENSENESN